MIVSKRGFKTLLKFCTLTKLALVGGAHMRGKAVEIDLKMTIKKNIHTFIWSLFLNAYF